MVPRERRAGCDRVRWGVVWTATLLCAAAGAVAYADPPAESASGVELVGRSDKELPPERWSLLDKATGNVAAKVDGRWGVATVSPGDYVLAVLPRGHGAIEVRLSDVKVEDGRIARIELRSGVDLVGRAEGAKTLEHWEVIDKSSGKTVAHTYNRWGFTPLPRGAYALR